MRDSSKGRVTSPQIRHSEKAREELGAGRKGGRGAIGSGTPMNPRDGKQLGGCFSNWGGDRGARVFSHTYNGVENFTTHRVPDSLKTLCCDETDYATHGLSPTSTVRRALPRGRPGRSRGVASRTGPSKEP